MLQPGWFLSAGSRPMPQPEPGPMLAPEVSFIHGAGSGSGTRPGLALRQRLEETFKIQGSSAGRAMSTDELLVGEAPLFQAPLSQSHLWLGTWAREVSCAGPSAAPVEGGGPGSVRPQVGVRHSREG